MKLDYEKLNSRLCLMDSRAALIDYIFRTQGGERARMNYGAAAEAIGVSVRTVGRLVTALADIKLLILYQGDGANTGELQLSPEIITT